MVSSRIINIINNIQITHLRFTSIYHTHKNKVWYVLRDKKWGEFIAQELHASK